MLETYKAKVEGDHIVWQGEVPESIANGETVEVIVTLMDEKVSTELRPIGLAAGEFSVPDDFDVPLPADVIEDFEN